MAVLDNGLVIFYFEAVWGHKWYVLITHWRAEKVLANTILNLTHGLNASYIYVTCLPSLLVYFSDSYSLSLPLYLYLSPSIPPPPTLFLPHLEKSTLKILITGRQDGDWAKKRNHLGFVKLPCRLTFSMQP